MLNLVADVTGLMERRSLETYDQLRHAALKDTGVGSRTRLRSGPALPCEELGRLNERAQ